MLSKITPSFKSGGGQNIALHAPPIPENVASIISAIMVPYILFFPSPPNEGDNARLKSTT